ncbi:hypothetical protein BGZ76_006753, partial [Entomortierella beljakovae]
MLTASPEISTQAFHWTDRPQLRVDQEMYGQDNNDQGCDGDENYSVGNNDQDDDCQEGDGNDHWLDHSEDDDGGLFEDDEGWSSDDDRAESQGELSESNDQEHWDDPTANDSEGDQDNDESEGDQDNDDEYTSWDNHGPESKIDQVINGTSDSLIKSKTGHESPLDLDYKIRTPCPWILNQEFDDKSVLGDVQAWANNAGFKVRKGSRQPGRRLGNLCTLIIECSKSGKYKPKKTPEIPAQRNKLSECTECRFQIKFKSTAMEGHPWSLYD